MYHPGTEATISVHPDAVPHHRRSGWLLLSEHQDNQAAAAAQAEAGAAKAKPGKTDEGK